MNNHSLQNTEGEPIRWWNDPSRTRRTQKVPFIAGCSHFTRKKTQGSVLRLSPNTSPMQHSCSHYHAICNHRCNKRIELLTHEQPLDAEHRGGTDSTMKRPQPHPPHTQSYLSSPAAATLQWKTQGFVLRLSPRHKPHATFMQPLLCDLQPKMQQTNRTTHTWTTTRCRTQRRNRFDDVETRAALAAHSSYLSSPAAATLHRKTQGFVLRLSPAHTTLMQPLHYDLKPENQKTHRTTHKSYVLPRFTPSVIEYSLTSFIVMWCRVSHQPSLSIVSSVQFLCDVNLQTILQWV